jgi:acyl-CoA synthetase (AMP-forming)/AMP-acid ligase II
MEWTLAASPRSRREAHYGNRVVSCFVDRPASVPHMVEATVAAKPNGEALVSGERRWSWRDVERDVGAGAIALAERGISQGDRVALLVGNRAEFVLALFAILRLGAIAVPLSTRYQTPEIAYALNDCGASLLIYDADLGPRLPAADQVRSVRKRVVVGEVAAAPGDGAEPWQALMQARGAAPPQRGQEEDTAIILYTSGTTGRPKGAMLTHLSLISSALVFQHCFELTATDRSIAAAPLAHVTGIVVNILSMVACGGTSIILPEFQAPAFLALAERERMTHTLLVPAMYNLCLLTPDFAQRDLSAWRIGGFGGAPMPEPTITRLAEILPGLKLMNAYGATETTSPSTIMPAEFATANLASVGLPVPNCEIMIVDDQGIELPRGQTGEIWIGGPSVVKGYWNRPDADAESFTAGYWHSGDIGSMDAEGFVYVHDRKKDMINRGGFKIFSAEVESVLASHPGVVESAIVARPCPVLGERVHAFVTVREPPPTAPELQRYVQDKLSDYKVPETFTLSPDPQPRNSNGKILKRQLREALRLETDANTQRRP